MSALDGTRTTTAVWLFAIITIAFAARTAISYDAVFGHDTIRFIESDAWYHMRLVDATLRHFPSRLWFDPYLVHPSGEPVDAGPFFDWVVAGAALVVGLGAPSPYLVDTVGAYVPVVMGALLCIPVYVLGRELCSRTAGLWAAFLIGVLPGQTLLRSRLGFTDHHCAETLLTTTALMWLVLAMDASRPFRQRLWLSATGGVMLGCYLLTWSGGSLFVFVIVVAAGLSLLRQRLRGEPAENLPFLLTPAFVVATAMVAPWIGTRPYFAYHVAALAGGLLLLFALRAWATLTVRGGRNRAVYLAALSAAAVIVVLVALIAPGSWRGLGTQIARLWPSHNMGYVREALPLLQSEERYPLPLWNELGPGLFLAVLGGLLYFGRTGVMTARAALFAVWNAVMLAATFGQVRFTYYLGVNAALLAAIACDTVLQRVGSPGHRVRRAAVTIALTVVVAAPLAARIKTEQGKQSPLTDDWSDALEWLNTNTPEPFADAEAYYRTDFARVDRGRPTSAYGVLAWWDYGYFIIRQAHRVPNTNPRQTQVEEVAAFLLSDNPSEAAKLLDALGSRYIVADAWLQARIPGRHTVQNGFFPTIAFAAGRKATEYCQEFERSGDGGSSSRQLYCFPSYYKTMAVRLYAFGARAVVPTFVTAISATEEARDGRKVVRITDERRFGSYEDASRFVVSHSSEHWRIASADPLTSCVPLEALPEYRHVFRSIRQQATSTGEPGPSLVQIYERSEGRANAPRQDQ